MLIECLVARPIICLTVVITSAFQGVEDAMATQTAPMVPTKQDVVSWTFKLYV